MHNSTLRETRTNIVRVISSAWLAWLMRQLFNHVVGAGEEPHEI